MTKHAEDSAISEAPPADLAAWVSIIEREVWRWEGSDELYRPFAIRLAKLLAAARPSGAS